MIKAGLISLKDRFYDRFEDFEILEQKLWFFKVLLLFSSCGCRNESDG